MASASPGRQAPRTGRHGDVFEGLADNARDCDYTDPKRHRSLFVDADGDGFGSTESVCATTDAGGLNSRIG